MENNRLITDSKSIHNVIDHSDAHNLMPKSYTSIRMIALALVLLGVSIQILHKQSYPKAICDTVSSVSFFIVVFGVIETCLRIYLFFLELVHLKSKYGGEVVRVFEALNLSTLAWSFLAASLISFLILHTSVGNTVNHIWNLGPLALIPALICSVVVCQLIGLRESKLNTTELIDGMGGVDYGTGIAYSYFYGYLKIILPADGAGSNGILDKMIQYEGAQNVTIPVKKLFILIPKSAHIPPDLGSDRNWLESTTSLQHEVRDRAGVKNRSYKNTVYKIHPGGDGKNHPPVYVTAEGATPMLTLWEILQHQHPQTAAYREHRNQIVQQFCTTLQMLLDNDPRCRDVCELVFYDDYDANRKLRNVGEILLKRITQQATYPV